ncbi:MULTISPECIES: hypothetical protein [Gordonia]|uniref:Uncharacterized protein n=1 Tax=Gordonia sputi NBRC 100414 TaxID=1089453 RepID=H5TVK1_9ACTN|nr:MULTISPECIES: hypothetical protein [Gordonia]NKY91818.1 hypothetical protein [Gordonia sputi]OBB98936.1 hypothetical protein A5785_21395 [Gordonia sp. 852002-50395_SCH5434458]GAB37509.1 hypothetical protein GOSPT_009_00110 [Gordonia sputi NBRC 100414]
MSDSPEPDSPDTDDPEVDDPDIPHEQPHESAFAFGDATPIGETDRIAREKAIYEAARHGNDVNRGHALGGSDGTTEGQ